jgi:tetratricopeptide (TPR) repeat protein
LTTARSLVAGGHDDDAAAPVGAAVELARTAGDRTLLMEAQRVRSQILIDRHDVDDALAAAEEAAAIAAELGDDAVLAQALIRVASAHCHYAREEEAVRAGREALESARRCGEPHVVAAAADQLTRTLITWWRYPEALDVATEGMRSAKRAGWVLEGAFYFVQGCLWYYLERFDDAERDFRIALQIAEDTAGERRWLISLAGIDRLKLRFFTRYMLAVVSAARGRWEEALASAEELDASTLSQTSYMVRNNVLNLWIEALLGRNAPGDAEKAIILSGDVRDDAFEQGSILDLSTCADLSRARTAARLRLPAAVELVDLAAQAVSKHAAATPLECDRAFAALGRAAADAGLTDRAAAAASRRVELRAIRIAAAGAAWGGSIDPALTDAR